MKQSAELYVQEFPYKTSFIVGIYVVSTSTMTRATIQEMTIITYAHNEVHVIGVALITQITHMCKQTISNNNTSTYIEYFAYHTDTY